MPNSLIFDIDGTLIDSVDLHAKAWQEAFEHFGHKFSFKHIRYQIGKGGDQLLPVFLSQEEIDSRGKELEEFRGKLFKKQYLPQVKPFRRVRELFLKARSEGQKIAIASSAKGDELKGYERIAGVEDLVDEHISSADAEKSKPHPDIFEAALERLGTRPESVLVIGDSPHDVQAAERAGLKAVAVLCGGFSEATLRGAGAIAVYKSPQELLERYRSSPLAQTMPAR